MTRQAGPEIETRGKGARAGLGPVPRRKTGKEAPTTLANPATPAARLAALRAALVRDRLDGVVLTRSDAHLGEYVPPSEERLAWLTGFSGSAGLAIVTRKHAALFVDGRYTLQAHREVAGSGFSIHPLASGRPEAWLTMNLGALGAAPRLGHDPWRLSVRASRGFAAALEPLGAAWVPLAVHPVDRLWTDRPPAPASRPFLLAQRHTGEGSPGKRRRLGAALAASGVEAAILVAPDSIAWLLNWRAADLPHAPVALAFAILHRDRSVDVLIAPERIDAALARRLGPEVRFHPPGAFPDLLDALGQNRKAVALDPERSPAWIERRLRRAGAKIVEAQDPCLLPKACKNTVEIAGMRAAHRRDGAALVRFLAWLDRTAPKGGILESMAAARVDAERAKDALFLGWSFPTISGAEGNGAIVHYRVSPETDRLLRPGAVFLVDSGGQYRDGTTDVTRTVLIGGPGSRPGRDLREAFTRVLKGHIALARVRFPAGVNGGQIDALARRFLWQAGQDYDHGTGHGVGHALNVHEGPQRIGQSGGGAPLEPGMVVSNEPGFYRKDAFGIRIENLMVVREDGKGEGGRPMRAFETLTLAPIDRRLIMVAALDREEKAWLDAYHARVLKEIGPALDPRDRRWLERATVPLQGGKDGRDIRKRG